VNEAQIVEEENRGKEAEVIARYYVLLPEPSVGATIAVVITDNDGDGAASALGIRKSRDSIDQVIQQFSKKKKQKRLMTRNKRKTVVKCRSLIEWLGTASR
jgi:hypothetical protein